MSETAIRCAIGLGAAGVGVALGLFLGASQTETRAAVYQQGFELGKRMARAQAIAGDIHSSIDKATADSRTRVRLGNDSRGSSPDIGPDSASMQAIAKSQAAASAGSARSDVCTQWPDDSVEATQCSKGRSSMNEAEMKDLTARCQAAIARDVPYGDCLSDEFRARGASIDQQRKEESDRRLHERQGGGKPGGH